MNGVQAVINIIVGVIIAILFLVAILVLFLTYKKTPGVLTISGTTGTNLIDFGTVTLPNSSTVTLKLGNSGTIPVDVTNIQLANSPGFTIKSPGSISINYGQTVEIPITFTPTIVGSYTSNLVISVKDQKPTVIGLKGAGASPSGKNFLI